MVLHEIHGWSADMKTLVFELSELVVFGNASMPQLFIKWHDEFVKNDSRVLPAIVRQFSNSPIKVTTELLLIIKQIGETNGCL